mgnify:CR=1 FL=1
MKRRWYVALLLGLLTPGLGQTYNGQLPKAIGLGVAGIAAALLLCYASVLLDLPRFALIACLAASLLIQPAIAVEAALQASRLPREFVPRRYNNWRYYVLYLVAFTLAVELPSALLFQSRARVFRMPTSSMENTLLIGDYVVVDAGAFRGGKRPSPNDLIAFHHIGAQELDLVKRVVACSGQSVRLEGTSLWVDGQLVPAPRGVKYAKGGENPLALGAFAVTVPVLGQVFEPQKLTIRDFSFLYYVAKQEMKGHSVVGSVQVYVDGAFRKEVPLADIGSRAHPLVGLEYEFGVETSRLSVHPILKIDGAPVQRYSVSTPLYFVLGDNRDNSFDSRDFGFVSHAALIGKARYILYSTGRNESILYSTEGNESFFDLVLDVVRFARWARIGQRTE